VDFLELLGRAVALDPNLVMDLLVARRDLFAEPDVLRRVGAALSVSITVAFLL